MRAYVKMFSPFRLQDWVVEEHHVFCHTKKPDRRLRLDGKAGKFRLYAWKASAFDWQSLGDFYGDDLGALEHVAAPSKALKQHWKKRLGFFAWQHHHQDTDLLWCLDSCRVVSLQDRNHAFDLPEDLWQQATSELCPYTKLLVAGEVLIEPHVRFLRLVLPKTHHEALQWQSSLEGETPC